MDRFSMDDLLANESSSSIARIPELKWLRQTIMERALTRGDYLLSGGARSDFYIDKFRLFSDPYVLRRIARLFSPIVAAKAPDLIAGTELGGVILATAVSQMTNIPMIVVRKAPKSYGAFADEYVEGAFTAGQHVLLLEDVVTSGREVMTAKERLEKLNLNVSVYAVISRGLSPIPSLVQLALPRGEPKNDN
jgi:orotate phosphoribosyltransferase